MSGVASFPRAISTSAAKVGVVDAGESVDGRVGLAGNGVEPHLVGFEDRAEAVVLRLLDRVVNMIVAASRN